MENFYFLIGFTLKQVFNLHTRVENTPSSVKIRKRVLFSTLECLVLLLHYIRGYPWIEKMAYIFEIKVPRCGNLLKRMLNQLKERLIEIFIDSLGLEKLPCFGILSYYGLVIDCTVQSSGRPMGNFDEI